MEDVQTLSTNMNKMLSQVRDKCQCLVNTAKQQASDIVNEAKKQAEAIKAAAKEEADTLKADTERDIQAMTSQGHLHSISLLVYPLTTLLTHALIHPLSYLLSYYPLSYPLTCTINTKVFRPLKTSWLSVIGQLMAPIKKQTAL